MGIRIGGRYKAIQELQKQVDLSMFRTHFSYNGVRISVICGRNSYGGEKGLLEMWNGQDEPEGYLTAEDIIKILKGERD